MNKVSFSNVLKELREEKGISQAKLGNILKLNQSTIAKYETGEREPSIEILIKIAEFFGVSVGYLVGVED